MRQRLLSNFPILGIGFATIVLLFYYGPLDAKRRENASAPPIQSPVWKPAPEELKLRAVYAKLPMRTRFTLSEGIPYKQLPEAFRVAIRDVLIEQSRARREHALSELKAGNIHKSKFDSERAYERDVIKRLDDFMIHTNGDNFAIILFRTLLPDRDEPREDAGQGPRGICRVK